MTTYSEVSALIARIAWHHDHRGGRDLGDFFAEDGVYHPPGYQPIAGKAAITEFFATRDLGDRLARHAITNIVILRETAREAEVASLMTVYSGDGPGTHSAMPTAVLDCKDSLQHGSRGWLIKQRSMEVVFRTPK